MALPQDPERRTPTLAGEYTDAEKSASEAQVVVQV